MTMVVVFVMTYVAAYGIGFWRGRAAAHRQQQRTRELDLRRLGQPKPPRWQRLV